MDVETSFPTTAWTTSYSRPALPLSIVILRRLEGEERRAYQRAESQEVREMIAYGVSTLTMARSQLGDSTRSCVHWTDDDQSCACQGK